jgi:hypothetical protein
MTLYLSNRDGNGKTNEEGHYKFPVNVFTGTVLASGDLLVTQQSPLALGVSVASGQFKILDSSGSYSFTGWNNASTPVTISTADPANPRITSIVLYVDKNATTSASPPNNPGIVKLMAVNGTAAAVPSAPNSTVIQTAITAGNPYIVLANVTVAAGATQVTNANISDQRVQVTLNDNTVSNTSLQDNSVSTSKMQSNSVTTAKVADTQITTRKTKPTYMVSSGNSGATRQQFPSGSTVYSITGTSVSYTSGATTEMLDISATALISHTGSDGYFYIAAGTTPVGKCYYSTRPGTYSTMTARAFYEMAANTTITFDARFKTNATGGGEVANNATDQSSSPSFGTELRLIAWGR